MAGKRTRPGRDAMAFEVFRSGAASELAAIEGYLERAREDGCPVEDRALAGVRTASAELDALTESVALEWGEAELSRVRAFIDGLVGAQVPGSAAVAVDQAIAAARRFAGYVEALMDLAAERRG